MTIKLIDYERLKTKKYTHSFKRFLYFAQQQSQIQNKRIVYTGNSKELVFKLLSKDNMGIQIFLTDLDEQLDNIKQYYKNYWRKNGNYKLLQHVWDKIRTFCHLFII